MSGSYVRCALCDRRLRSDQPRYRVATLGLYDPCNGGHVSAWYCADCWRQVARTTAVLREARAKLRAADPYKRHGNRVQQPSLFAQRKETA